MWLWLLGCPGTIEALPGAPPRDRALDRQLRAAAGAEGSVNRLILEQSPYLKLHGRDPVDWRAWGPEAFEAARALDRPIFLSIGYATCHWCHVMQEESFTDLGIAAAINKGFVPIAVDREERPDVDQVYLRAVQELAGSAGWPATLVLTPDGDVVFAGTYLPAHDGDRGAARGLASVLDQIVSGWASDRASLLAEAAAHSQQIREAATPRPPGDVPGPEAVDEAVTRLRSTFDPVNGGFGGRSRFPRPATLDLLLAAGDLAEATQTLRAIAGGGLHDRLGGGFHRYTVDPAWQIPHFEKMAEDQALLASTFADASVAANDPAFAWIARETLGSLAAFALPDGGWGTALDADSLLGAGSDGKRVEGAYYTWTPGEVDAALGAGAAARLGIGAGPAIKGGSEPRYVLTADPAPEEAERLRQARSGRAPPPLDAKWIVGTNARIVAAFAHVGRVLGDPALVQAARTGAERLLTQGVAEDGRMRHGSTSPSTGTLDDQVFAADAWLELLEATGERAWLDRAVALMDGVEARWADPAGGWFRTADDVEVRLFRPKDDVDPAGPSAASTAVRVALRLAEWTGDPRWLARADRALAAHADAIGPPMPAMAEALALRHHPGPEIVVSWTSGDPGPLLAAVRTTWAPGSTVAAGSASALGALGAPWLADKVAETPVAWVCRAGVCQAPSTTPEALRAAILAAESAR